MRLSPLYFFDLIILASCDSRPLDIPDGMVRYHLTRPEDQARYWCNEGYEMNGTEFVTCSYGTWEPKPPTCKKSKCSIIVYYKHTVFAVS